MWKLINNPTPSDLQQCQLEEMFCQRDAPYEYPSPSKLPGHSQKKSSTPERASVNCMKPADTQNQAIFVDKYLDLQSPEQEDGEDGSSDNRVEFLKTQRHRLEKDVVGLQDKLQQEIELHYALENACRQEASLITNYPNLPEHAQELVADVAMLEMAISHLEEQIASLNIQLCDEQRERLKAESSSLIKLPSLHVPQTKESTFRDTHTSDYLSTRNSCSNPISPRVYKLPHPSENALLINNNPRRDFESPINQSFCPTDEQTEFIAHSGSLGCKHFWQKHTFFSPEKLKSKPCESTTATSCGDTKNKIEVIDLKDSWLHPNKLSQEMVNCMVSIYQHLADPMETNPIVKRTSSSPTSPYGIVTGSSISSISEESSFISFARSPSMDSQRKDIGSSDRSFDPYKTNEKLPWSDIGNYSTAIEVSEMLVGKEQLDYAAEALRMFRSLVEQLSRVDPSTMKHDEKLAFWINVYNALMMHAYLAYGVPKNDFKFFSLMQKAAYTVGGHSFNAVVIEHLLLKAKAQWYRPQIALLLAHQKLKLRDEVSMFAIDHAEPLVTFSLSFGASSSPAIRVYTAGNVHEELQSALQDYARASVGVNARGKVLIPKLLFDFACDIVEESEIPEWICQFLPCQQSSLIRNCIKHRQHRFLNSKHLSVVPFDFRFRYLFLLAHKQQSIHPVKL